MGVLFGAGIPTKAKANAQTEELFSILLKSFEISNDTYDNYESIYNATFPIKYIKTDNPGYLALGGSTAGGYGANGYGSSNFANCYANKFASFLGFSSANYSNKAENGLAAEGVVNAYIKNRAYSINFHFAPRRIHKWD